MRPRNFLKTLRERLTGPGNVPDELERFDWKFYISFYPDLRRNGIDTKKKAVMHWLQSGRAEGRIGGRRDPKCVKNFQIMNDYLKGVEQNAAAGNITQPDTEVPFINILTRSNQRPRFFHDNRNSVVAQTHEKFRQLICYENHETLKYLRKEGVPQSDLIPVIRKPTAASHPYNLFVNELMDRVTQGWILFLDDDDLFTTPHALAILAPHLADENQLVIWKAWFPDKIIPFTKDIRTIEPGGITSCCFAFHSKHREKARWDEHKAGDYRCFDQLRAHLDAVFLDEILTKVNYTDSSAGWGEARDKKR